MKFIVLCGGYGTKLWPLSRRKTPKQFTFKVNGKTIFRNNIEVLLKKYKPEDVLLATSTDQKHFLREQAPEIPEENYFLEPCYKSHGAATARIVSKLFVTNPDETFSTVQVDDLRLPEERYLEMLDVIDDLVQNKGKLVTGGILKEKPEMGSDYLHLGNQLSEYKNIEVYELAEFLWRTDYEKTLEVMKKDKIVTHTNHWSWTPRKIIEAFKKITPNWGKSIDEFINEYSKDKFDEEKIFEIFSQMDSGPIEFLTEHLLSEIAIIRLPFEWIDLGTWENMKDYIEKYEKDQKHEKLIEIDSKNNFVYANKDKLVSVIGLEDVVVIDTENGLLVAKIDKSGEVGNVVKKIEEKSWNEYL